MEQQPISAREQIEMEGRLARQLLEADDEERAALYATAYDQIFTASLSRRGGTPLEQTFGASPALIPILLRYAPPGSRVLEVGCGTGYLTLELAAAGRDATGVDVSPVAIETARDHARRLESSAKFEVVQGMSLPFDRDSHDFVFSVEVLEHLHERDVPVHLAEVYRVLKPGGRMWVLTPNGTMQGSVFQRWRKELGGADDARDGHDGHEHGHGYDEPGDVHLKEWTYRELVPEVRRAGFRRVRSLWGLERRSRYVLPPVTKTATERIARLAPNDKLRARVLVAGGAMSLNLLAEK